MEAPFVEWLIGQAGIGGLAALSLFLLNREHQDAMRRERENADAHRADKLKLLDSIALYVAQIAALENALEASLRDNRTTKGRDDAR